MDISIHMTDDPNPDMVSIETWDDFVHMNDIDQQREKENLIENGWTVSDDPRHPGEESWKHRSTSGFTYTRSEAVSLQVWWNTDRTEKEPT